MVKSQSSLDLNWDILWENLPGQFLTVSPQECGPLHKSDPTYLSVHLIQVTLEVIR